MTTEEERRYADLEQLYGPEYKFSDHKRGEHITYHSAEGPTRSGTILWVQEPGKVGVSHMTMRYVVEPDEDIGFVDFCWPADVIEDR